MFAVEKVVTSKLLVPGANRRIQIIDRHIGMVCDVILDVIQVLTSSTPGNGRVPCGRSSSCCSSSRRGQQSTRTIWPSHNPRKLLSEITKDQYSTRSSKLECRRSVRALCPSLHSVFFRSSVRMQCYHRRVRQGRACSVLRGAQRCFIRRELNKELSPLF